MSIGNHNIEGKNMTIRWKPHILNLDPFCLIEVFEHLDIDDLCGISETCTKLKAIAEKVFILKCAKEVLLRTTTTSGLHYVPVGQKYVQANRMLRSFRHLIKSLTLQGKISYRMHPPGDSEYIVKLIMDKATDFKDLFFRRQEQSLTEKSHLKEYSFVRHGAAEYFYGGNRTATEICVFELIDDQAFAQKLQAMFHINAASICVNVSLPPTTVSQLCLYAPKIEYLALYQMGDTNFDINALSGLRHLKVLNLSLCNATAEHLKCLFDLNVTIECLFIRAALVDDSFVANITKIKQLRSLVITDVNSLDENRLVEIVVGLPKLNMLVIDKIISVDVLEKVQKCCPSLLELEVKGLQSPFKWESVKKLLKTLHRLYIASSNSCENTSASKSGNKYIYLAQSIPAYYYMFENMAKS